MVNDTQICVALTYYICFQQLAVTLTGVVREPLSSLRGRNTSRIASSENSTVSSVLVGRDHCPWVISQLLHCPPRQIYSQIRSHNGKPARKPASNLIGSAYMRIFLLARQTCSTASAATPPSRRLRPN